MSARLLKCAFKCKFFKIQLEIFLSCPSCWWGEFAKEGASHKCPGCVKGLPVAKDVNAGKVIDLTEDVDDIIEEEI